MIIEIAIATNTAPRDWWEESDETLATALEILDKQATAIRKAGRKRGNR